MSVVVFFISLPVSVWLLANLLGALEERPRSPVLIRIGLVGCAVALFLLATETALWRPMGVAFALVFALHAIAGWAFRNFSLGIDSTSGERPRPVTLEQPVEDKHPGRKAD